MNLKTKGMRLKRLLLAVMAMCLTAALALGCVSSVSAQGDSLKEKVSAAISSAELYNTSTSADLSSQDA